MNQTIFNYTNALQILKCSRVYTSPHNIDACASTAPPPSPAQLLIMRLRRTQSAANLVHVCCTGAAGHATNNIHNEGASNREKNASVLCTKDISRTRKHLVLVIASYLIRYFIYILMQVSRKMSLAKMHEWKLSKKVIIVPAV